MICQCSRTDDPDSILLEGINLIDFEDIPSDAVKVLFLCKWNVIWDE